MLGDHTRSIGLEGARESLDQALSLVIDAIVASSVRSRFEPLAWDQSLEAIRCFMGNECVIIDEVLLSNLIICILKESKLASTLPSLLNPISLFLMCAWSIRNEDAITHYKRYVARLSLLEDEHRAVHSIRLNVASGRSRRHKSTRIMFGAVYLLFACYLNGLVMVTSEHFFLQRIHQAPLEDIASSVLPFYANRALPDYFVYSLLTLAIIPLSFHRDRLVILVRALLVLGSVYLVRSLSLMLTILPDPSLSCVSDAIAGSPGENLFFEALRSTVQLRKNCGDMIFSGHTSLMITSSLFFSRYLDGVIHSPLLRIAGLSICWLVVLGGCLSIIITRLHYTIDVVVAIFAVTMIFRYYHYLVTLPFRNKMVAWFECFD